MCCLINNPINSYELASVTLLKNDLHKAPRWHQTELEMRLKPCLSLALVCSRCLNFSSPRFDPGFSDPSFLQGSVYEEPALKTTLRSSLIVWHNGSMPGIAFSIIWASFSFSFSLVSVCSYYVSVSFSLSLTPIQGYGPARVLSLSCLPWAWHTVCGQYRAVDGMTQSLCAYSLPLGKVFFFPLNWIQPSKL